MPKTVSFTLMIVGFLISSTLWAWIAYPQQWYPGLYVVGFYGVILMFIGGIGALKEKIRNLNMTAIDPFEPYLEPLYLLVPGPIGIIFSIFVWENGLAIMFFYYTMMTISGLVVIYLGLLILRILPAKALVKEIGPIYSRIRWVLATAGVAGLFFTFLCVVAAVFRINLSS
ncbi:MAG: hypothetical protein WC750_04020 [Patescibacteria group bacterium]